VCSADCGDGDCAGDETHATCPQDCPADDCGDGIVDAGEDCDATNLNGYICADLGFVSGDLTCGTTCLFDTTGCSDAGIVTLEGIVWSPGADEPTTLGGNRFPVPGALVIAHSAPPTVPPPGVYCNTCADEQPTDPFANANVHDGTFSLDLVAGASYWLTVRKGAFQRSRQLVVPDTPGETFTLEDPTLSMPRPVETTLPHLTDLAAGDHIPRIGILEAAYEDPQHMLSALGLDESADVVYITAAEIPPLVGDATALSEYNVLLAFTSESYPLTGATAVNLRAWVQAGGTLFADDFAADYVEQPWPEFLTWFTSAVCGDGPTPPATVGECNNWSSYSFVGAAVPSNFTAWLNLPNVHNGAPLVFDGAWNLIHGIHPGLVGEDQNSNPIV